MTIEIKNSNDDESGQPSVELAEMYKRFFEREKKARKEAEQLLEQRSRELYLSNQRLATAATELEKEVQRTNSVFATAAEGIVIFDATGRIESLNEAGARAFGFQGEEALGCSIFELIPSARSLMDSENRDALSEGAGNLAKIDGTAAVENNEVRGVRRDGTEIPLEFVVSQFSHLGEVTYSGIVRDLTRRKTLERKLAHAQKMESVGQLAAGVAHELNTPIQFVSDNTSFLKSSFEDLDSVLKHVQALLTECRNQGLMEKQVGDVDQAWKSVDLDFIRNEIPVAADETLQGTETLARIVKAMKVFSHPGSEDFETIDLNQALKSTLTVSRSEWKYHTELVTDFGEDIPPVRCFPAELNQVFLNLIVNAADAMRKEVDDSGDGQERSMLTIRTSRQGDFAVVEVTDTGHGIPESIQHRVFDPFFTTKGVGKGTGQGLSICYDIIVELHGGQLTFESAETGTTFRITLPL